MPVVSIPFLAFVFTYSMAADILVIILLLLASALFSSSEVAFFSLSPAQILEFKEAENKRLNKIVLTLLRSPKKLIATILIANTFVNIFNIILSALFFSQIEELKVNPLLGFLIQVITVTFLITLFGEVMPKVYAAHNNVKILSVMAYPVYLLGKVLSPLSIPLVNSTTLFEKILRKKQSDVTLDELNHAIQLTSDEESPPEEKRILQGIVRFGNMDVKQVMKSRPDVVAFSLHTSFKELLQKVEEAGYSRIPVYDGSIDNIKGVLHIKDLLAHLHKENYDWQQLVRKTYFIPESKKINDLLQEFQQRKIHMAVIVDEFGATAGIITLEDVLEEIVGELKDEFDDEEPAYTKIDENNYVFEAKTALNDVCRIMEIDLNLFDDIDGEIDTLAGLILELNKAIPSKNENIFYKHITFHIEAADRRKIKRVKITIDKTNIEPEGQ
jgi:gliding motility-associated protein GldE